MLCSKHVNSKKYCTQEVQKITNLKRKVELWLVAKELFCHICCPIFHYMKSAFSTTFSTQKHQEHSYVWRWSTAFQHSNPKSRHENSKPSTSGYDCSQHAIKQRYHNNLFKLAWIYWSNKIFTFFFHAAFKENHESYWVKSYEMCIYVLKKEEYLLPKKKKEEYLVVYKVWAYCEQRNKRCTTGIRCKQSKCLKKLP